ncbi:MAG: ACT domain-containing protein [Lachnospiraceae bacterium]|nr:ACT domain-containing protein [Lachnospiraceae bacterium]
MIIKQLSIFLENKPGTLNEALKILKNAGINISALSVADTSEFGLLRLIVDDPDKAKKAMKESGYTSSVNDVLSVELKQEVGYLSGIIEKISKAGVNIEYMYASSSSSSQASIIIKTDDLEKTMGLIGE